LTHNRQHLSCDDCLEVKREDYQNCPVLYCVLCTSRSAFIMSRETLNFNRTVSTTFAVADGTCFLSLYFLTIISSSAPEACHRGFSCGMFFVVLALAALHFPFPRFQRLRTYARKWRGGLEAYNQIRKQNNYYGHKIRISAGA